MKTVESVMLRSRYPSMPVCGADREIYFHVGLGKTATKYLQANFFPKLKGVKYIKPTRYRRSKKIIRRSTGKILVSREFDRQFEREVKWFSQDFPDAKPIMVLRRHDEWILSQFKRFVKNGYTWNFNDFFNLENTGFFKVDDLFFYRKIEILENLFSSLLVLIYDELVKEPFKFLDKIVSFIGTTYDREEIKLKVRHASFDEKQLKVIYKLAQRLNLKPTDNLVKRYLFIYPIRYSVLYSAKYLPGSIVPKLDIFPDERKLGEIRKFFEEDWKKCVNYVLKQKKEFEDDI